MIYIEELNKLVNEKKHILSVLSKIEKKIQNCFVSNTIILLPRTKEECH
jgi:hypothetical protein